MPSGDPVLLVHALLASLWITDDQANQLGWQLWGNPARKPWNTSNVAIRTPTVLIPFEARI